MYVKTEPNNQRLHCVRFAAAVAYPRFGPFGTRNGATTPTRAHSVVKQIMGSAREWDTMAATRTNTQTRGDSVDSSSWNEHSSMAAEDARSLPVVPPTELTRAVIGSEPGRNRA